MTTLTPGDFGIGPTNARLRLRTYRQGLAAKAGHDLLLEAAEWKGHVRVPGASGADPGARADAQASAQVEVEVEVDLRRLEVLQGTGGVKPLTEGDKNEIRKQMRKPLRTDVQPLATFRSSNVRIDGDHATVTGELSLAGQSHPIELDVHRGSDGRIMGGTQVLQTHWGIKPYTGFFGALKLRDAVDIEFELHLPS
jgi:hypothetical protein